MTIMTGWELFEDLRTAQEEMLRMNAGRAWWPGQRPPFVPIFCVPARGHEPATSPEAP